MYLNNNKSRYTVHVRKFLVWTVFSMLLAGCAATVKYAGRDTVKALQLYTSLPVQNVEGKLVYYENRSILYESRVFRIYEVPVTHNVSQTFLDTEGETVADTLIRSDVKFRYFIFRAGESTGIWYDSSSAQTGRRQSVDSFLAGSTIRNFSRFYERKWSNDSLLYSSWSNDSSQLTETYIPKVRKNDTFSDTTIMYFRRSLDSFSFSLFRHLDSLKRIKLAGLVIKYNGKPGCAETYSCKKRELAFDVQVIPAQRAVEVDSLIQRYKRNYLFNK